MAQNLQKNHWQEIEKMCKDSGFTLLELMIAIAILAILATFVVPNMITWRSGAKLSGAVFNLRGDLEQARLKAIQENTFVAVLFTANDYTIFVDNGAGGGTSKNWDRDGGESLVVNRDMPAGVTIDLGNTTFANNRMRFNERGRCVGGTVIIVNSAGVQKSVVTSPVGRIRVQ